MWFRFPVISVHPLLLHALARQLFTPKGFSVPQSTDNSHIRNPYVPQGLRRKGVADGKQQA